jgi:preprotein translocase subunit Sss1
VKENEIACFLVSEFDERMVDFMIEKIIILHELKLAGFDISANLEKMYRKYGREEFQKVARNSGYGFILK